MELGEKLKAIRMAKQMKQEDVAELSGITLTTISKYELGTRKPKPEQLQKIANALGISVHALTDIEINTLSDLASLIFAISDCTNAYLDAEKDENGNYIPDSFCLRFKDNLINNKFCSYMNTVNLLNDKGLSELRNAMLDDTTKLQKADQEADPIPTDVPDAVSSIAAKKEMQDILLECNPKKIDLMLRVCREIKNTDI